MGKGPFCGLLLMREQGPDIRLLYLR